MEQQTSRQQQRSGRQDAQREMMDQARRTAGVAEAMRIHDAVSAYLTSSESTRVAGMHYATGGNQV